MITIIDYGVGNLRSVQKAFEAVGFVANISSDAEEVAQASHLVLPGVGAFGDAIHQLTSSGLDLAVKEAVKKHKPVLGICLGMQLLFDRSFEHEEINGLGLIPGQVKLLPQYPQLKIPHIGWNTLTYKDSPLFNGLGSDPYVYFVHSYYYAEETSPYVIATTQYCDDIPVAVQKDNLYGVQFHPEKSGSIGLQLLKNFGGLS